MRHATLEELVNTTLASMWPAEAEPGMTLKLPLRLSTVHVASPLEGAVVALVEGELLGTDADEEDDGLVVAEDVGTVVVCAFGGELLLHPARASPAADNEAVIATR